MSDEPPAPPSELPPAITDVLDGYSADRLRTVSHYAEKLAEHKERETDSDESDDENEVGERTEDRPDSVPSKATITIKEINDNRYYYWQWRDGDKIRSKYKGPVGSDG